MEPINQLPPQLIPNETSAILNRAFSSFKQETTKLMEMTKDLAPQSANLGKKIDLKA